MTRERLVTEYTADTRGFRRGAKVYDRTLKLQERLTNTRLTRIDKRLERSTRSLLQTRTALTSIGTVIGAFEARKYAEEWRNVERRLKSIGVTGREAQQVLVDLAIRTRGSMVATATAVQRMAKSTDGDFANATRRVETLQKLLAFGGASGTERDSVSLQLGQALKSGQLSGDEYKSISENAPVEFLDALAEAAGIARSELKGFAQDQQLTTAIVLKALDGLSESADKNFKSMAVSGDEAMAVLNTGIASYVGRLDTALGATISINGVMQSFGEYLAQNGEGAETFAAALQIGANAAIVLAGSRGIGAVERSLKKSAEARRLDVTEMERQSEVRRLDVAAAKRQEIAAQQTIEKARKRLDKANKKMRVVHAPPESAANLAARQKANKNQKAALSNLTAAHARLATATGVTTAADVRLTAATGAVTAAQNRLNAAYRIGYGTMKAMNRVMAFFGGPIGLVLTSLTIGFGLMGDSAETASEKFDRLTDSSGALQTATDSAAFAQEALTKALADRADGSLVAAGKIVAATKMELAVKIKALRVQRVIDNLAQSQRLMEQSQIEGRIRAAREKLKRISDLSPASVSPSEKGHFLETQGRKINELKVEITGLSRKYDALDVAVSEAATSIAASNEILGSSLDDTFNGSKPDDWAAKVDAARDVVSRFIRQNMSDHAKQKEVLEEVSKARDVLIQKYGEESYQVTRLDAALAQFQAELKNTKSDTEALTGAALTLHNALSQLGSVQLNLSDRLTLARAKISAIGAGATESQAEAMSSGLQQGLNVLRAGGSLSQIANAYTETVRLNTELNSANEQLNKLTNPARSGGGRGGQSAINQLKKDVDAFIESMMTAHERQAKKTQEITVLRQKLVATYGDEHHLVAQLDEAIVRLHDDIDGLEASTKEFFGSLSDAIASSITDWKGWGNFVGTLLASLISKFGEQFFTAIFTPGAQSGSDLGTKAGNYVTGQVAHSGGVAGGAGVRRRVPAAAFNNAPRYHDGSSAWLNLKANEVPAILERGEIIIPNGFKSKSNDGLQVHIHENASDGGHRVQQSDGRIDVFLKKAVVDVIGAGGADGVLNSLYGITRSPKGY